MSCRRVLGGTLAIVCAFAVLVAPADAHSKKLKAATYPGMTTFSCRTDAIELHPGQNLNDFNITRTCPNAQTVKGPLDPSIFNEGSPASGYITRFKPSMVEILPSGKLVTPSVWDLHLHHVVWIAPGGGPTFASGEEKTIPKFPQGYGLSVDADANWGINQMIHDLGSRPGRRVYMTWEIDWVPQTDPARTDIVPAQVQWLDVAGAPHIYPVFDAKKSYDLDGDGKYVFPDDVPTDPSKPGYDQRASISNASRWTVPSGGATLVFGAGHLHPGGLSVDLKVARDGPDADTIAGTDASEIKRLFHSGAHYYEPAGAVSWDVALEATRKDWRISLKPGDVVSINVTYNVKHASWYESMGILPLAWSKFPDPAARDPFDNAAAVKRMYKRGGILTHGRLHENIDRKARNNLKLPDPRDLPDGGLVPASGIDINSFYFTNGGYSVVRGFPASQMRPPVVHSGDTVTFTNQDATSLMPETEQAWHSVTSCRAPCNKGSGIGYPLANGPIDFDSGQLGYGSGTSTEVTTGSNVYTTPPLKLGKNASKGGTTYTYFCRIHPFMRGSIRVEK